MPHMGEARSDQSTLVSFEGSEPVAPCRSFWGIFMVSLGRFGSVSFGEKLSVAGLRGATVVTLRQMASAPR